MDCETLGTYQYHCPPGAFPLGGDSLALGDFATLRPRSRICDLGTGAGLLLLLLAQRGENLSLTGVEIDPRSAQAARENLTRNGLVGQIIQGDMGELSLKWGQYDLVVSNPPYFPEQSGKVVSAARSEISCTLEQVCTLAGRLLRNGGRFALCHRPERLADVFSALRGAGIEPKRMRLIAHSPQHPPSAVLVEGVRQGRPGLSIEV